MLERRIDKDRLYLILDTLNDRLVLNADIIIYHDDFYNIVTAVVKLGVIEYIVDNFTMNDILRVNDYFGTIDVTFINIGMI